MEHRDRDRSITFAYVECKKCGHENSYDVMDLSFNSYGFFRAICPHCETVNVYHGAIVHYEMITGKD